ncbi:MAG: hypothetical protein MRY79_04975, partial [Alphaproteobacteria bacterium]|nr:hypothetical protein [Alphaproteobacteria bacterium]
RYGFDEDYSTLAMIVAMISSAIFAIALTLSLHNKSEQKVSEINESQYSGNMVFLQLSCLLSLFLVLLVGSYFFFNHSISQNKDGSAILNAASLQRMLLVRYTHRTSIIIAAHATQNWQEVSRNNIAAQRDEKHIENNYRGLLEGGRVILSVDGKKTLEIEAFADENIRQALLGSQEEWEYL